VNGIAEGQKKLLTDLLRYLFSTLLAITLKTARKSAVAGYRGMPCPFKIRRIAAIVFQFRVVAGAP
jgi:hypothetical protein